MTQFVPPLAQQQIDNASSPEEKEYYRGYWQAHNEGMTRCNRMAFVIFLCIVSYFIGIIL
jgi:hypothetical protein